MQFFAFNEEPPRKLLNVSQGGDGKTLEDRYGIENAKKAMANFTTPAGLKASDVAR